MFSLFKIENISSALFQSEIVSMSCTLKFGISIGIVLLENKIVVIKGEVIANSILEKSDLNFKSINLEIKSLLRKTRNAIKSKGSQVSEINTSGNFVKKIRDFLKKNQNTKFKLEVVSLKDSKVAESIIVEINILKISS